MKKVLIVGLPLLLAACGTLPSPADKAGGLSIGGGKPLTLAGTLQATRHTETESSLKHLWTLTKTPVDDGQANTAVFNVTATHRAISTIAITSQVTTVNSTDLSVCNPSPLLPATLTASSAVLTGLDSSAAPLPTTIDLGNLLGTLPLTLAAGACTTASFTISSTDAALSAAQKTMLDTAAQFTLTLSVSAATSVTYQTPAVTPAVTSHNTPHVFGDNSVTLDDPGFTAQGLSLPASISADTTVQVSKTLSCADRDKLQLVPGTADQYLVPNTATLSGPNTSLSAQSQDTVTLNCTVPPPPDDGCTFTQGYYKTHAQFRSAADAQRQALNRQYDPNAWKGARDWFGSETRLSIGGVAYAQADLVTLYLSAPRGNQALSLFHQLVTAKLNGLKEGSAAVPSPAVAQAIAAADAFFAANANWQSGQYSGNPAQWIAILTDFNEGLGNGHC